MHSELTSGQHDEYRMSQSPQSPRTKIQGADVQTPIPKKRPSDCPPAPVKRQRDSSVQGPSRQTLTSEQIRQIRESWNEATKREIEDQ